MEKLGITLLLVEDDVVIRNIYKHILTKYVTKLYIAGNGEQGYNSYLENKPDLILTDIKMPILNGLDMIKKIRENDKFMRIIIMSAYGESRFFLKAIETGVKGFLIKPVETEHLLNIIREQAKDILLEKRLNEEEVKRLQAEKERDRRDAILSVLLNATAKFFNSGVNDITVHEVLGLIGEITEVSRAYIYKIHTHESKSVYSYLNEWVSTGVSAQLDNQELKNISTDSMGFKTFEKSMKARLNVSGFVEQFDEPIRSGFIKYDIKSLLAIPIYVKDNWWGYIGFDDCNNRRTWSKSEINALEMLAYILGGAIFRREVEEEMTRLNASLEERVWERTKELEQEVTERTIAESLLKDSEEKYRHIYENANDGIMLLMNNKITLINPSLSEIIGLLPKDIIGNNLNTIVKPEFIDDLSQYFAKTKSSSKSELQVQLLNKRWLEIKATTITWDYRPAFLVFVSDITKRKNAQNELFRLNKTLEMRIEEEIHKVNIQQQLLVQKSKLESIGELSAGLAHEINQPLGGLSMGLENILYNINTDGVDYEYLKNKISLLFNDIDRIQKIIEHVRLFSRDQENTIIEKVSVNQVIENALSLITKQMLGRKIEIVFSMPDEQVEILGNRYRLEQVLLNIISNARFAVEEKEKHGNTDNYSKRISIDLSININKAIITIADNGVGINIDIISKVFDPFFTTKSEEKGTGLGLSISYGIISEMNGNIEVESELGKYTKMIITLPIT
jgi:PAS domain S-box-containing protein